MLANENGLNITEKSEVPAQTPPFKGGTALFSLTTVVAYGSERVKYMLIFISVPYRGKAKKTRTCTRVNSSVVGNNRKISNALH